MAAKPLSKSGSNSVAYVFTELVLSLLTGRYDAETVFVSLNPIHCDTSGRISAKGQQVFEQLLCGEWDGCIPEE